MIGKLDYRARKFLAAHGRPKQRVVTKPDKKVVNTPVAQIPVEQLQVVQQRLHDWVCELRNVWCWRQVLVTEVDWENPDHQYRWHCYHCQATTLPIRKGAPDRDRPKKSACPGPVVQAPDLPHVWKHSPTYGKRGQWQDSQCTVCGMKVTATYESPSTYPPRIGCPGPAES